VRDVEFRRLVREAAPEDAILARLELLESGARQATSVQGVRVRGDR